METEFQKALKRFAEYLNERMGESKATHFMNKFAQIPPGNAMKTMVEALILYTCEEYGISRDALLHSTKMIHCYARITCYHILKKHIQLPVSRIAGLFNKKKKDPVIDGIEKAQGMLDVPQYNPDFVAKYKSVEKQYKNFSESIHERYQEEEPGTASR